MRILVLSHRLPYAPNRGDRIRLFHLLRILEREHEVRLVSLVHDEQERARVDDMRRAGTVVTGVPVNRYRNYAAALWTLPTSRPLTHALLDGSQLSAVLSQEAMERPDVIVAYGTGMMRCAMEDPLRTIPCVLDMVDVDSEKWAQLSNSTLAPMRWIYGREAITLRQFERSTLDHAFAVTVVSERERALAVEVLGSRSPIVVSNGVDVNAFAPTQPPCASNRIVFSGVFDYRPNEEAAIWLASEVWPLVRQAEPDAMLQLVGMRPSRAVRELARNGSVQVTGEVPDVRPYLWSAAAAAAPLFLARGVQNKVLEALAAGLPCVVSPGVLEGLPPTVRSGCFGHAHAADFAATLVRLLRLSPAARRDIAGTARVHDLSWGRQLAPFVTLLRDAARLRHSEHSSARAAAAQ